MAPCTICGTPCGTPDLLPAACPAPPSVACQVVEAIEYLKRPERLGLGAQSVPTAPTTKRPRKMGGWRCGSEWGCVGKCAGGLAPTLCHGCEWAFLQLWWEKAGASNAFQQSLQRE